MKRLRELWRFLKNRGVKLEYTRREDLFEGPQNVVQIQVPAPSSYPALFKEVSGRFSDLVFYDADIAMPLRFAAARDVFMMAHCEVTAQPDGRLMEIRTSDTPSELDPKLPRFRKLNLRPDTDPSRVSPKHLLIKYDGFSMRAPLTNRANCWNC